MPYPLVGLQSSVQTGVFDTLEYIRDWIVYDLPMQIRETFFNFHFGYLASQRSDFVFTNLR